MDNMENRPEVEVEAAPAPETPAPAEKKSFADTLNGITSKFVGWLKATPLKKLITLGCIILTAAIVLGVGIGLICHFTNYYMTPINAMAKIENSKEFNVLNIAKAYSNGLEYKEAKALYNALCKVEDFEERMETYAEYFEEELEENADTYGDNWKVKYKVEDKEKLEKSDLREFKDQMKSAAENIMDIVDRCDDYDSDDWEEICDRLDIDKNQAKDIVKKLESFAKALKNDASKITEGYELDVVRTISGSDDDDEDSQTIRVYKINGKWVSENYVDGYSLFVVSAMGFLGGY